MKMIQYDDENADNFDAYDVTMTKNLQLPLLCGQNILFLSTITWLKKGPNQPSRGRLDSIAVSLFTNIRE